MAPQQKHPTKQKSNLSHNKGPKNDGKGGNGDGKGGNGGNGNGGNSNRYGAYAGYKGVKRSKAKKLVNVELKEAMNMFRRELQRGQREAKHEIGKIRDEFKSDRDAINHTYGQTGAFIGQQNTEIDQRFAQANEQATQAQAALMAKMQGLNAGNTGAVGNELSRLGMDASQFTGQLQADQGYAEDQASINGSNNMANLAAMQAGSGTIGNLLLSMNEGAKTNDLSKNRDVRNDQLGDIRFQQRDWTKDVRQQMLDMKSQKGGMIRQLMEQLAQTGWAQHVDNVGLNQSQQALNMQRQQMQHGFAMDRKAMAGGSGSGSSGSGSANSVIENWLNPNGSSSNGGGGPTPPPQYTNPPKKKPKKGSVWGGQLPGNYPGDSAGYLP